MATIHQIEAARRNGALSRGPVTPEGKARSAQNARTHGLASSNPSSVLINGENQDHFNELHHAYFSHFLPDGDVEAELVREMVHAAWRLRRYRSIENGIIEVEMLLTPQKHPEFQDLDFNSHLALAFKDLADGSNSLQLLGRYCARLNREYHRALKALTDLQAARAASPPPPSDPAGAILPIEPPEFAQVTLLDPLTPPSTPASPPDEAPECP